MMRTFGRLAVALCLLASLAILDGGAVALPSHDISIEDLTKAEGSGGGTTTFDVTINVLPPTEEGETLEVKFSTAQTGVPQATEGPSGLYPDDFAHTEGTANIPELTASVTVPIQVVADSVREADEAFLVKIFEPRSTGCALPCIVSGEPLTTDGEALVTITNDDAPSFAIDDVTVSEGDAGTTPAIFTVTKTGQTEFSSSVNFATANGTATQPADYTSTSGTLTFGPLETEKTVSVDVKGDLIDEVDETFVVNLSGATNATIADAQGTGTISDDDGEPTLAIDNVTVTEGNAGTTPATFTVTKSGPTTKTVTVDFATADGTATQPSDYTAVGTTTLSFAPAEMTKTITVNVNGDETNESDETFFVNLSGATNASITDGIGIGTITNDDQPQMDIDDVSVEEGGTLSFTVSLTKAPALGESATFNYATSDGTATDPDDYTVDSGSITFNAGFLTRTVTIATVDDTVAEPDETMNVTITKPVSCCTGGFDYDVRDGTGVGTITDDDNSSTTLSIDDVSMDEGSSGSPTPFVFTVTKTGVAVQTVTVDVATTDGTATQPSDYTAVETTTLTFAPSETTKTVTVDVAADTVDEPDQTFFVNLSNATNASITDAEGEGTIQNDDAPSASLSIDDQTTPEGDSGTTPATFTVTKTGTTEQTVTVDVATADGTATQPADYTAVALTTLTFLPGDTSKTVTVDVNGDTIDEPDQTYTVDLTNPTNATITDPQGLGTITDDDDPVATLAIDDVTMDEGSSGGSTPFTFTVTKTGATEQTVTVDFATADSSALAPDDYAPNSGTLVFAAADVSKTITVNVVADTVDEVDQTFLVDLTNPTNATITDDQGLGTIINDDAPVSLGIDDVDIIEGNVGTQDATFTVTKTGLTERTVTVDFSTANGTATQPADYTSTSGTLTIAAGDETGTVVVPVKGDTLHESDETFFVNLSNATNATATDDQGLGTIIDDEGASAATIHHDFNGDGFDDAAFGAPGEDLGSTSNAGAVNVVYGSEGGLSATTVTDQILTLDASLTPAPGDRFGTALVTGDFDGDGFADLAVGAPGRNSGAGVVEVFYGSSSGLDGGEVWEQGVNGIDEVAEPGDNFGSALAAGDVNGDGRSDLIVGALNESLNAQVVGAAHVILGSVDGLVGTDNQFWHLDVTGVPGTAANADSFARSLAVGDMNDDGFDDVLFGIPGSDVDAIADAGAGLVLYGSAAGLATANAQLWHQDTLGVEGVAETGDEFAFAVAVGDLNGDGFAEAILGAPREALGSKSKAGAVNVLNGSAAGLTATGNKLWNQDTPGIDGVGEPGDAFGSPLHVDDFDDDGFGDLAVGVRGEDLGRTSNAGVVNVIYGSGAGLTATGDQVWHQNSPGIGGTANPGDKFGSALSSGDFEGDGTADLIVGVPAEDLGGRNNAGAANVIYGSVTGLSTESQLWHQNSTDVDGFVEAGDKFASAV